MKAQQIIQALYSFFLGLVVVGFVAVGLMTFYPQSRYDQTSSGDDAWRAAVDSWSLGASIIPVSYTHLDVYKRQVMIRTPSPPITRGSSTPSTWPRSRRASGSRATT